MGLFSSLEASKTYSGSIRFARNNALRLSGAMAGIGTLQVVEKSIGFPPRLKYKVFLRMTQVIFYFLYFSMLGLLHAVMVAGFYVSLQKCRCFSGWRRARCFPVVAQKGRLYPLWVFPFCDFGRGLLLRASCVRVHAQSRAHTQGMYFEPLRGFCMTCGLLVFACFPQSPGGF